MIRQTTAMLQTRSKPQLIRIINALYDECENLAFQLNDVTDSVEYRVAKCEASLKMNLLVEANTESVDPALRYILSELQSSLMLILHRINTEEGLSIDKIRFMLQDVVAELLGFMFEFNVDDGEGTNNEHTNG